MYRFTHVVSNGWGSLGFRSVFFIRAAQSLERLKAKNVCVPFGFTASAAYLILSIKTHAPTYPCESPWIQASH
jgi:hypothetical protein